MKKALKKLERLEYSEEGVNVEDLLKLTIHGDSTWVEPLKALVIKFDWKPLNTGKFVPLATWVDVLCEYFSGGMATLIYILQKKDARYPFVLGILEELANKESVEALMTTFDLIDLANTDELAFAKQVVYTLNIVGLSAKKPIILSDAQTLKITTFLKNNIVYAEHKKDVSYSSVKALSVACFQTFGTRDIIPFLKSIVPLEMPYVDIEKKIIKKILKKEGGKNSEK